MNFFEVTPAVEPRWGIMHNTNDDNTLTPHSPPVREVLVMERADLQRIKDEAMGFNKAMERLRGAAKERKTLHLHSQEVAKKWSNTLAGQRKKKLEAKRAREEMEEEKRKLMDIEEVKYKEEKRKETVEKAEIQRYYHTDRIKGLHRGLLLAEVLKEREAQVEQKQKIKNAASDGNKLLLAKIKTVEDKTLKEEHEKTLLRKREKQAFSEELRNQIKENELARAQQKQEKIKEDEEEFQHLQELHQKQQRMKAEKQAFERKALRQACEEHLSLRDQMKMIDTQRADAEEEQRKLFLSVKEKTMNLRKEREKELLLEAQLQRQRISDKLTAAHQEKATNEDERMAKAAAERDARQEQVRQERARKKAEMLKSISEHRENMRQEKELREKAAAQRSLEEMMSMREVDRVLSEIQQLKAKKTREEERKVKEFNVAQMAEKEAKLQHLLTEEQKILEENTKLAAVEDKRFQLYSQQLIHAAEEGKRNVFPLYKAAREGLGAGQAPVFGNVPAVSLIPDDQMLTANFLTPENPRNLHEVVDFAKAKKRLGLTWS